MLSFTSTGSVLEGDLSEVAGPGVGVTLPPLLKTSDAPEDDH